MYVITGATGELGGRVVERMLERVAPEEITVVVRDEAKAAPFAAKGVRVVRGEYEDPQSIGAAVGEGDTVLVVTGPSDPAPHIASIDAAVAAGAGRIVYTSHQSASEDSAFQAAVTHARIDEHLRTLTVPFTSLHNGFYAFSAVDLMGDALESGTIRVPADGPVSWTAHDDLADAAVVALTTPEVLDGMSPPLVGGELLDFEDIARIASAQTGRDIVVERVSDEEWVARQSEYMPAEYAEFLLGIFRASRAGEFAVLDPALAEAIGHPTKSFADVLAERRGE